MKNIICILLLLGMLSLISCNDNKYQASYENVQDSILKAKIDSIDRMAYILDSVMVYSEQTLDSSPFPEEIQRNIDSIKKADREATLRDIFRPRHTY